MTALLNPVQVSSKILRKELPILTFVTLFSGFLLLDLELSLFDAALLLLLLALLMVWTFFNGLKKEPDALADDIERAVPKPISLRRAMLYLVFGLLFLILSSRLLVWGAVEIAQIFGVSDLIIGLTIVAVGTSLPELASSILAAKKGEHDIAIGNVIGSNLFNTTAVVGVAGAIKPFTVDSLVLSRDMVVMTILTISLFIIGYGFRKNRQGRVNRFEGAGLLIMYAIYTTVLIFTA